ncbi:hypothetical protein UlMin_025258 [Ulmus minor]
MLYSDIFEIRGRNWRLKIYPKGNNEGKGECLSIYLEVPLSSICLPDGWSRNVKCILSVINQIDSAKTVKRESDIEFTATSSGRGYAKMLSSDRLNSADEGFLVNDTIIVEVDITQPTLEEGDTFAKFHTLFGGIQNLLKENTSEEISHAKKVLNECFSLNFANVMQTRRKIELKNAFSTMCHVFADTKKVAVEVTKFVADFDQCCEQYVAAQEDLEEAKEKENLIGELKTSLKQLYDVLIPVLDRAKEIEREIAKLERKLGERKAMKVQVKDDLEGLAGRASCSKQALIDAEQEMKLFMPKKEQAQTMIDDIEKSWKSFKSLSSRVLQYTF